MKHLTRSVLRSLIIGGLVLAVGGLVAASWQSAWGQGAVMRVVAPSSVPAGGGNFSVRIEIEGAQNLGAYEWWIRYDRNVVKLTQPPESAMSDGSFLGSTGRTVSCLPPILPPSQGLEPGNVRFGCNSAGAGPGVNGNGLLSTISFVPVASGSPSIQFVCAGLADPLGGGMPISNVPPCVAPITPTPGPGQTPAPTSTPRPGAPPAATSTPTGPLPTPTPLPPGLEAVGLVTGCNPVASTYLDHTPIGTIASRVGRAGILTSIWKFNLGAWLGYSPQFPQVSDLTEIDFLDAVFICVNSPGDFVRPIV